jgi:HK97 family phage prohead protease
MKKLICPFAVKAAEVKSDGTFEGVASPFGGAPDAGGDIIMPGAFANSLRERFEAKKRLVPMLWQHNSREPIGVYPEVKETTEGLIVRGQCNMKVQRGIECHALMEQGALTGLSIGYDTIKYEIDNEAETRKLIELDLWEISPVTFPMADSARVTLVKSLEDAGNLSDCEALLRDAGFSKSEATAFVSRVKTLAAQRSDSAREPSPEEIRRAIEKITNG